jgi:hypothetical protein
MLAYSDVGIAEGTSVGLGQGVAVWAMKATESALIIMKIISMIIRSNTRMHKPIKTKGNQDVIVDASSSLSMEDWTCG